MNDSQTTPATSGTNEVEKPFKETVKKNLSEKNDEGKSLFDIIRNIVKEEFKIHKSNIKELKTTKRLDKLSAEIVYLTASLELTQRKIEKKKKKKRRGTIPDKKRNKKFKNRGRR